MSPNLTLTSIIISIVIICVIIQYYTILPKGYQIQHIQLKQEQSRQIMQFYNTNERYPLGSEYFSIRYPSLGFFQQIGKTDVTEIKYNGSETVGMIMSSYNQDTCSYYVYGLKVKKEHRGLKLSRSMTITHMMPWKAFQNWYCLSMGNKLPNYCNMLMKRSKLYFYILSADEIKQIHNLLISIYGNYTFASNAGKKELILESTSLPLNLMHLVRASQSRNYDGVQVNDGMYMICALDGGALHQGLTKMNRLTEIVGYLIGSHIPNQSQLSSLKL